MNKCVVELIGTFFLVLAIGITVLTGKAGDLTPFAIAGTLMAMIFAGGHISGAHYNPAVTYGFLVRGRIDKEEAIAYVIFQSIGAIAAAFVAWHIVGSALLPVEDRMLQMEGMRGACAAFFAELIFTFALMFVILNVATAAGTANNHYYGLAIATTVLGGALTVGWISGASFNPAVTFGGAIMKIFPWSMIWVHLLAEFVGAYLAAKTFLMVDNKVSS